jgi:hypothetical protein
MPRRRFRWTRENYRKAASLVRFLARHPYEQYGREPALVRRFVALWDRHPQQEDPLLRPHWQRFGTDSIPF